MGRDGARHRPAIRDAVMAKVILIATLAALQGINFAAACSPHLVEATWRLVEDGEIAPYALMLRNELVSQANVGGGTYAIGATLTAVGELAWPRPASACGHSKIINAEVAKHNGHLGWNQLADAVDSYAVVLTQAVDNLRMLGLCCIIPAPWPHLENSCGDYGRIYKFEESWDLAMGVSKATRCAARRLYIAFDTRANNVGAAATSAATSIARGIIAHIQPELVNFLKVVVRPESGSKCECKRKEMRTLAGILKSAIWKAADAAKH